MAIILGTNAYIELQSFKDWCSLRNYDFSQFTDNQINGAIVVCSLDFIDTRYTFKGDAVSSTQVMQLPTSEVGISEIELGVGQAVWQQLNGQLLVDLSTISAAGEVKREMKKLDVMEKEVEYTEYTSKSNTISTTRIDALMRPYVVDVAGGISEAVSL